MTKKEKLTRETKTIRRHIEGDEALKAPEYELERLLQEVKSKQDTSTRSQDLFMDLYESMTCDYVINLTVASLFFSPVILGLTLSQYLKEVYELMEESDNDMLNKKKEEIRKTAALNKDKASDRAHIKRNN